MIALPDRSGHARDRLKMRPVLLRSDIFWPCQHARACNRQTQQAFWYLTRSRLRQQLQLTKGAADATESRRPSHLPFDCGVRSEHRYAKDDCTCGGVWPRVGARLRRNRNRAIGRKDANRSQQCGGRPHHDHRCGRASFPSPACATVNPSKALGAWKGAGRSGPRSRSAARR